MTAEIVSIGTELLMGQIADTNAQTLGRLFPELGITHRHRQTVGDNLGRVVATLQLALSRSDIVFTIGGLGPTEDDLTREGIAAALDDTLVEDPLITEKLRKLFAVRNLPWVESQRRQAMRPTCAIALDNPNGTAPGLICEKAGKVVIALPGPKSEFNWLVDGPVREFLAKRVGAGTIVSRILRITGMGEGLVEEKVRDMLKSENPSLAPYAQPAEVHLRITAKADSTEAGLALIEPVENEVRARLGTVVYGTDKTTLEDAILQLMREKGLTLSVAESCTGGLLGGRLTTVSGSSDVFAGGAITYSNALKTQLLGVPEGLLAQFGAVSEETAAAMAQGARERFHTDWALSVTGVAGPTGGSTEKPVGLVYLGCAGPNGVTVEEHRFRGSREIIRGRAVQNALTLLRNRLLE